MTESVSYTHLVGTPDEALFTGGDVAVLDAGDGVHGAEVGVLSLIHIFKKITEKLPASLNGIRPMLIYPLGGILIVGVVKIGRASCRERV